MELPDAIDRPLAGVVTEFLAEGLVEELVEEVMEATVVALTEALTESLIQLQSQRLQLIPPWGLAEAVIARPQPGLPLRQSLLLTSGQLSSGHR